MKTWCVEIKISREDIEISKHMFFTDLVMYGHKQGPLDLLSTTIDRLKNSLMPLAEAVTAALKPKG